MWRIPFSIIAFCANKIKELISQENLLETYELIPWAKFKVMLFQVYDHRIENAHEINGLTNMNYCTLQEYVLIYAMDKLKDRSKAEHMIVTMFINLRYFYD